MYKVAISWGLTGRNRKPISRARFYKILRLPDYFGEFEYTRGSDNLYKGNYEPLITKKEWEFVQKVLQKKSFKKNRVYIHSFRGLLRCGECRAVLTSYITKKKLKSGKILSYVYYESSRKKRSKEFCSQKLNREDVLEKQILQILSGIEIPEEIHKWAIATLKHEQEKKKKRKRKEIAIL